MEKTTSIFVNCRKWHDKVNGNTYFSNQIWVNGKIVLQTPMAYGYGEQYLWDALGRLVKSGYITTDDLYELRKNGIVVYNSEQHGKKRDLFGPYSEEIEKFLKGNN